MTNWAEDELEPGNPYSNPWNWVADVPEKGGELIQLDHGDLIEYDIHGQVLMRYTGPKSAIRADEREKCRAELRAKLDELANPKLGYRDAFDRWIEIRDWAWEEAFGGD